MLRENLNEVKDCYILLFKKIIFNLGYREKKLMLVEIFLLEIIWIKWGGNVVLEKKKRIIVDREKNRRFVVSREKIFMLDFVDWNIKFLRLWVSCFFCLLGRKECDIEVEELFL